MPSGSFLNPTTSRTQTIPRWFGPVLAVDVRRGNPLSVLNPFARPSAQRPGPVFPSTRSLRAAIRSALRMLFQTRPGERLFLPDYGLNMEALVFEVIDSDSSTEGARRIRASIERFIPQVRVVNVQALQDPNSNAITFQISMQVLGEKPNDLLTYSTPAVPAA